MLEFATRSHCALALDGRHALPTQLLFVLPQLLLSALFLYLRQSNWLCNLQSGHVLYSKLVIPQAKVMLGLAIVAVAGCSGDSSAADPLLSYGASERQIRYTGYSDSIRACMKAGGFSYEPPAQRAAASNLDFRQTLDPRFIWGRPELLVPDGLGIDPKIISIWRNLASLGSSGEALSAADFAFHKALEGTVEEPGCEPKARQKYGGFSLEEAQEGFYSNYRASIERLKSSADYRRMDTQFVRCSKARGYQYPSALAFFPTRRKALQDAARAEFKTETNDSVVLGHIMSLDKRLVSTYTECVMPHAEELSDLATEFLGD